MCNTSNIPIDCDAVAIHELGHALVQAALGIGPQQIRIYEAEGGGWQGQSLPSEKAITNELFGRLLASQMAGPIAQICLAPASLGTFREEFTDKLLIPALDLRERDENALCRLLWASDLERHVLPFAKSVRNNPFVKPFYEMGGFLFSAESAIFKAFKAETISRQMDSLSSKLVEVLGIDGEEFHSLARPTLDLPIWNDLRSMDWVTSIRITSPL